MNISGADYRKMKLFVLSLLWRAHISNNAFFKEINVADHEKDLRRFINAGDPGPENLYTVSLIGVKNNQGKAFASFPNPGLVDIAGGRVAFFFINGMIYFIRIDKASDFKIFESFYLKESGEVKIPLLSGELAMTLLQKFALPGDLPRFFLYDAHFL